MKKIPLILLPFILSSCSFFAKKKNVEAGAIARVNDEYLYASDVQSLTKGLKGEDSILALKNYAESWARKKLLLQKAIENIPENDVGITKKIEDYREALVLYEYEKALINQKLDTVVKPAELESWYEKMKSDFPLEQDVYLLLFIKVKKDATDLKQAKKWLLKPKDDEDLLKLAGYCKEYASVYEIKKGVWYELQSILKSFPVTQYDLISLAATKTFREFKSDEDLWFIRVADVLKKDQPAPLELVRSQIVKIIIEKRRLQLVEKFYDKVYQDGMKSKSLEIMIK